MVDRKPIPTPLAHRWRRFRYSWMPFVTFGLMVWATLWLWDKQTNRSNAVGEIEATRIDVSAPVDGTLSALGFPQMFELVKSREDGGEPIAILTDPEIKQELETMQIRRRRMLQEIEAEMQKLELAELATKQGNNKERTRLAWQGETRQLRIKVLEVDLSQARPELRRLENRLGFYEKLDTTGFLTRMEYENLKHLRDQTKAQIAAMEQQMAELIAQQESVKEQQDSFIDYPSIERDLIKAPLLTAVEQQDSRIKELQIEIDQLTVYAPISGMVTAIYFTPGQVVEAGQPILAVSQDEGQYIVSYIRQDQKLSPREGDEVFVRAMAQGSLQLPTQVTKVGVRIEKVPGHQRRDPRMEEWGLPVKIKIPPKMVARPGELIDVTFRTKISFFGSG
jgi:multidrug resistance efflux pump